MNTLAKHIAAIKSGAVDRSTVTGLRKLLNASARAAAGWSTSATGGTVVSPDDVTALLDLLNVVKPSVIGELVDSGRAQLTNRRYAKQLSSMADIVADIQGFKLIGFEPYGTYLDHYTPVYRAYNLAGKSFPFINLPWQSGGHGPEIMHPSQW